MEASLQGTIILKNVIAFVMHCLFTRVYYLEKIYFVYW